ncbi:hypothetical protein IAQ61_007434 [Plenodomus lingam]|uniref:uncharacterized protein n=1 Tax=Leptosphaeria maculans TaxID=5022 RepID=UPI00332D0CBB|nr:hypothetical protein IAQ61_007434 [Plenodomus lingam]
MVPTRIKILTRDLLRHGFTDGKPLLDECGIRIRLELEEGHLVKRHVGKGCQRLVICSGKMNTVAVMPHLELAAEHTNKLCSVLGYRSLVGHVCCHIFVMQTTIALHTHDSVRALRQSIQISDQAVGSVKVCGTLTYIESTIDTCSIRTMTEDESTFKAGERGAYANPTSQLLRPTNDNGTPHKQLFTLTQLGF